MPSFTWLCPFPIPPISPCFKHYSGTRESKIVIHKNDKYEKVLGTFESMDYETIENEISKGEKKYGLAFFLKLGFQRNVVIALVGVLTALSLLFMNFVEHYGFEYKLNFLKSKFHNYFGKEEGFILLLFLWILGKLIPLMAGGLLVVYIEPVAAGGGIPGIIGYLNGIRVPRIVNIKVLIVKLFSTIFMLLSNVPAGREGPLIHIGAILGASTPMMYIPFTNIRLFKLLHNDHERRDMTSVGVASGLTAAFLTPIGGVILALEEGVTYYSRQLPGRVFLGAFLTAYFVTFFVSSMEHDCLSVDGSFKFFEYTVFEIPLFVLIGIIGGLAGSAWNYLEMEFTHFRKRFIKQKKYKLIELGLVSIVISLWSFCLLYFVEHCRTPRNFKEKLAADELQMYCPKGEFPSLVVFLFQPDFSIIKYLISEERAMGIMPLCTFVVYNFVVSAALMGACISGGIFVPNLISGASWGRLLAELIRKFSPKTKVWCHAQKYAFLAAGAQLGGTTRICFSLGIIMLESSANMVFGLPIFVVVITSKLVADMFSHPIYHAECLMKGMPLLEKRPPPYCSWILVKEVMNEKVVALTKVTTVGQILTVLKTSHNGFPIVDPDHTSKEDNIRSSGRLLGIILRSTLVTILQNKLYKSTTSESLKVLRNQFASAVAVNQHLKSADPEEEEVDLGSFMHKSPMFIQMRASFTTAYSLMAALGLRHIVAVNSSNEVVGVITRKDMAVHKSDMTCCTVESKVVPFVEHL